MNLPYLSTSLHTYTQLRECDMGPIINRELKQRVRSVPGITLYNKVIKNDIQMAAKLVASLDDKWKLWTDDDDTAAASGGQDGGSKTAAAEVLFYEEKIVKHA